MSPSVMTSSGTPSSSSREGTQALTVFVSGGAESTANVILRICKLDALHCRTFEVSLAPMRASCIAVHLSLYILTARKCWSTFY